MKSTVAERFASSKSAQLAVNPMLLSASSVDIAKAIASGIRTIAAQNKMQTLIDVLSQLDKDILAKIYTVVSRVAPAGPSQGIQTATQGFEGESGVVGSGSSSSFTSSGSGLVSNGAPPNLAGK